MVLNVTFFACFAISALLKKKVWIRCVFFFYVDTIFLYLRWRTITKMKSKLKHRIKAYLLALLFFVFVHHRRIWFATNSDRSPCFFIVVCHLWLDKLGSSPKKGKKHSFWWSVIEMKKKPDLPADCLNMLYFIYLDVSPHVTESGFRNPGIFCLWNPESWALESGIQH